jgi:RNA polymerase sigma-70 factor (ECF subfamily)
METSPRSLVERWRQGDQKAAEELFQLYVARLVAIVGDRISRRFVRHFDPGDVIQSAFRSFFMGAREGRFEFERDGDLWRLLVAVTLNKLRIKVRSFRAEKRDVEREEYVPSLDELCAEHADDLAREPTPVAAVALADEVDALMQALNPNERTMLEMRLQGYDLDEIARATGRCERTVRRVLDKVRALLQAQDPTLPPA